MGRRKGKRGRRGGKIRVVDVEEISHPEVGAEQS